MPRISLCWLQLGRAYPVQGDTVKAKAAYQDFDGPFYVSDGLRKDDIVICCGACKSPPMRDPIFRGTSRSQIENYERFSPAVATESLRRRGRISLKVHCQKRKDKS